MSLTSLPIPTSEAVKTLLQEAGYENIEVKKDLAGLDRVVYGMYS